ncbi:hypothetical protein KFL01_24080 [Kocuria flava]|uniref:Uncharacterized protein n=1 Tax=Kocuria flava TaxID=446860 RepID=A0ABQ0X6L4_9MICC|nr:hypothetical protein KFL01_24080 [Kocuria flava]
MNPHIDRDRTDLGLARLPEEPAPAGHACRDGWLGDDDAPRPCPVCRPHLIRRPDGWRIRRDERR